MANGPTSEQKVAISFLLLHAVNKSLNVLKDSATGFNFEHNLLKGEV